MILKRIERAWSPLIIKLAAILINIDLVYVLIHKPFLALSVGQNNFKAGDSFAVPDFEVKLISVACLFA